MSQNQMHTTLATMEGASKNVKKIAAEIQAELSDMQSKMRGALDGAWVGEAAVSCNSLVDAFAARQTRLHQVLTEFADGISSNMSLYAQHEDANRQATSRLTSLLA